MNLIDIPFFRIGVDVASYGPNLISMHFSAGELVNFTSFLFRLRTVLVVGSLYWARSRLQPSIFRSFFPTYLESVPPRRCSQLSDATVRKGLEVVVHFTSGFCNHAVSD